MKQYVYHYHAMFAEGDVLHHNDGIVTMNREIISIDGYRALKGELAAEMDCDDDKKIIITTLSKIAEYDIPLED